MLILSQGETMSPQFAAVSGAKIWERPTGELQKILEALYASGADVNEEDYDSEQNVLHQVTCTSLLMLRLLFSLMPVCVCASLDAYFSLFLYVHTLPHSHKILITCTCCYDLTKGTQDKDFSYSFFDSLSMCASLQAYHLCVAVSQCQILRIMCSPLFTQCLRCCC